MDITERSFANIYDEFAPKIFKFCYFRVSSKEEAEDLTSQVFIKTWDHLSAGGALTNIQGFLYRIANNLVIDFYRKNKNRHEVSIDSTLDAIDLPDATDFVKDLDLRITIEQVQSKLELLSDAYREVITLKYISDLSLKEIAHIMDTTENNISVRLHRAIEKLKKLME